MTALSVIALTTACTQTAESSPPPAATEETSSAAPKAPAAEGQGPRLILRHADDRDGDAYASLVGELAVTDDNCLGVISTPPSGRAEDSAGPVIWPAGWSTRLEDGKAALYDADGHLYASEGDKVSLPGSSSGEGYLDHPCASGDSLFKVNNTFTTARG